MENNNAKIKTAPLKAGHRSFSLFAFRFSLQQGFTLLETVVALTVILATVVGPVSLVTRGLFDFSFARNKLIAINLAQEGIEIIRLVRENNIACAAQGESGWQWNHDPDDPQPSGRILTRAEVGVDINLFTPMVCGSVSISTPHLSSSYDLPLRFEPNPGFSYSGTYGYAGSEETFFFRRVAITSGSEVSGPTQGISAADQMDVVSTVSWNERGILRNVVVRERLYNWR